MVLGNKAIAIHCDAQNKHIARNCKTNAKHLDTNKTMTLQNTKQRQT
jgi:hypothetical protein